MSRRSWQSPFEHTNSNRNSNIQLSQTQVPKCVENSPDGSIFVRTVVQLDPDSDLFMKVAQRAYADHERSLIACLKCGRKFFPERIENHQKSCAASKLQSTFTKHSKTMRKDIPTKANNISANQSQQPKQDMRSKVNTSSRIASDYR